jgi:GST-like protein
LADTSRRAPGRLGKQSALLPISATYVIDRSGRIVFSYLDADFMTRLEPTEILVVLRRLTDGRQKVSTLSRALDRRGNNLEDVCNNKEIAMEVYAFATPNSIRIPIALEELGIRYELKPVNVRKGEQKHPDFLQINPNGKVPVLIDKDGPGGKPLTLSESGAILVYLAEKTGKLLPADSVGRARVFEQLFFHLTAIGPALGQLGFFKRQAAEQLPLAIARFQSEAERVLSVLEGYLGERKFAAGDAFTIADIVHFGWLWRRDFGGIDFERTPNIGRWYAEIEARPAVKKAMERVAALVPPA